MADVHSKYNEVEKLIDDEKFEEAISGLTEIIAEDDSFVLAHLALARVYTKTDQHELAIQHGEKVCELEPGDPFNFTAMSVTYQRAWAGTQNQQFITKAEDAMARGSDAAVTTIICLMTADLYPVCPALPDFYNAVTQVAIGCDRRRPNAL